MKIIQSYWSKPSIEPDSNNPWGRSNGGWYDKKYYYMSFALSCLQFRKFYKDVELITDKYGLELLVDKMNLPYSTVSVCLDNINSYSSELWALGKIHSYQKQSIPFIHADTDIYIYEKFPSELENSSLIVQNIERLSNYYIDIFSQIENNFSYIPEVLRDSIKRNNKIISINAGILGGCNIEFIKEYTELSLKFVNENILNMQYVNKGLFNLVYEQFLFYALAEKYNINIKSYFLDMNQYFDGIAELTSVPTKAKYIHVVGTYKKMKYIGELISQRLLNDYPEYYFKIITLLRTNQI